MTAHTNSERYQQALKLAEAGQHSEALTQIREYLRSYGDDAQALNDAGAILHCLGRSQEALPYLKKAHNLMPDSGEIVWNLIETYLGSGMATEAAGLFDEMEKAGLLNVDLLNRTATQLVDQTKKGQAIEVLLRSQRLWPEQEIVPPMLEVIRGQRPKVGFFYSSAETDRILAEACAAMEQRFQTEFSYARTYEDATSVLQWCDIAWFDGGGDLVVDATRTRQVGKTVVSLRRSDICGDWVTAVRWENVDILMQLGSIAVEEALTEHVPDIRNRTRLVVLGLGVNLDRFAFRQRPAGKHLACMGPLSLETNPAFLLQCMQKLHYIDPEYRLSFAGRFESPVLEQYLRHMVDTLGLTGVVSFAPSPFDPNAWLADKHFIVSGGMGESQTQMLLQGMAAGLKPVIHNFPGAQALFPTDGLFNIAEEFCEQIVNRPYTPAAYRRFVEQRYPMVRQVAQVHGILTQLEMEIDLQATPQGRGSIPIANTPGRQSNPSYALREKDVANLR